LGKAVTAGSSPIPPEASRSTATLATDDQPGRYIYLRRKDTGEYWGATWQPVRADVHNFECRHGAGYTRITTERAGARAEVLYFVPPTHPDDPCPAELWVLRLTNTSGTSLDLQAFSYVELSFLDAQSDLNNLDWAGHVVGSHYDAARFAILAGTRFSPTRQFFASDKAPDGYDCDRESFVGRCRGLEGPIAVILGRPGGSEAPRGNSIGSLYHEVHLAPGAGSTIVYMLGVTDAPDAMPAVIDRYREPAEVENAFALLRADWDEYLSALCVTTPDPATTATANYLAPLQCRTTLYWSRFVSGYETGLGRGIGTRDTAQDTLGVVHTAPGEVASRLQRLWELQFRDGHAWHQFFPLTGEGGPGLARERPEWPQWFCDDHLWLVIATCNYLKETGDYGYLGRHAPYMPVKEPGRTVPVNAGAADVDETIWAHMMAAVGFTLANRGPHGLPRSGFADWDDTLNVDHGSGLAESMWGGMQFCRVVLDLAELAEHLGRPNDAERFRGMHAGMARAVNDCAWDGSWYARCFDDEGKPIGVSSEARQRISLIPQSWGVISEVAPRERAELAMASAHELLGTPYGPAVMWPPYDGGDPRVQGTSTFPPGAKENGGIFCHAASWSVVAAAQLGDSQRAYEYHRQLMPLARLDVERTAVEPYVYCQNICGPTHPQYGLGRNAWLTGASAWMYVAITQWILGIRPTHAGLRVAPCIPAEWAGFSARRRFRGTWYDITVTRTGPGNAVSLLVNGSPVPGDVIALPPPGTARVTVEVDLGAPSAH
jgi:cellobiose phosphorylase